MASRPAQVEAAQTAETASATGQSAALTVHRLAGWSHSLIGDNTAHETNMDDSRLDVGRRRGVSLDGGRPAVVRLDQTVQHLAGLDASLVVRSFCGNPVEPS